MSTHVIQQHDLARAVAALRRAFGKLLKRLEQPVGEADYTIKQWCEKRKISRAVFYKMRKAGRAPHVLENGGLRRITREADREWEVRWGSADAALTAPPAPNCPCRFCTTLMLLNKQINQFEPAIPEVTFDTKGKIAHER